MTRKCSNSSALNGCFSVACLSGSMSPAIRVEAGLDQRFAD